ncbi:MAG: hypothetical protein ACREID_04575 [Planctomycetota bacterium]
MRTRRPLLALLLLTACGGGSAAAPPPVDLPAPILVTGTYAYQGTAPEFSLRGTIAFEQVGDVVRVVEVVYDNSGDRPLIGEATLEGDRLEISLVPENGDTDFRADVTFVFNEDRSSFQVEFADTNGDTGGLGSYVGTRELP